jgi:hypothetical protein
MSGATDNTVSGFLASLLHLLVIVIVLGVVNMYATTKVETGEEISLARAFGVSAKNIATELQDGWNQESKNDTLNIKN